MKPIFKVLILLLLSPLVLNAQVISEWRGIGRTGVYNESGLLQKWPETGPEMLWSVQNLPKGNSSVAAGTSMLYTTGLQDDAEVLVAIDYQGKIIWQVPFGKPWEGSFSESRATPTIENDRVYVSSGGGDIASINAINGDILWKVNVMDKFEGIKGKWGLAESPLLIDNKIIFTTGGEKTTIVALNKSNGETIWTTESVKDEPVYTSPILIEYNGNKQIIAVTNKYIIGVSPDNGKIIWKFDFSKYAGSENRNNNATTPLYFDGDIYVTSGYNHSGVMLKLSPDGTSVSLAWTDKILDNHHGGVVKVGNYIFGSNWQHNGMGKWVCLNWNTGAIVYEQEWINKGSIIAAENYLYCYEEKTGTMGLVKAIPEKFEVISSFKISMGTGPHWAHPVIHNKTLYIRHGNALMAYNIKNN